MPEQRELAAAILQRLLERAWLNYLVAQVYIAVHGSKAAEPALLVE
jgi:hypothetical protein